MIPGRDIRESFSCPFVDKNSHDIMLWVIVVLWKTWTLKIFWFPWQWFMPFVLWMQCWLSMICPLCWSFINLLRQFKVMLNRKECRHFPSEYICFEYCNMVNVIHFWRVIFPIYIYCRCHLGHLDFDWGMFNFGLLVRTDKLSWILKLHMYFACHSAMIAA